MDHLRRRNPVTSNDILSPEDFTDVFGGPPRTILHHHFSAADFFYEDIFKQQEKVAPVAQRRGRNLPVFNVPAGKQSSSDRYQQTRRNKYFSRDVFGWDSERVMTSGSRSKTSSSSAMSSEERSPLRPAFSDGGYDDVSMFASKFRSINVRSKWDPTRTENGEEQKMANSDNQTLETLIKNFPLRFSRRNESEENTINFDRKTANTNVSSSPVDDPQFNSPASSSEKDEDEDENEMMSSYVIEIESSYAEMRDESNGVDEAIAWVREKFQAQSSEEKPTQERGAEETMSKVMDHGSSLKFLQGEMQLLDEKIRLWSFGKEADIRLLLSSLHHILWPNSGWFVISVTNLIESSQVKKAYQKAVLCLHPDKLQQRGASIPQKYIAEKAFSTLQDAWAAFATLDVFYR